MSSMKRELSDLSELELKLACIQLSGNIVYKECEKEEGPLMGLLQKASSKRSAQYWYSLCCQGRSWKGLNYDLSYETAFH